MTPLGPRGWAWAGIIGLVFYALLTGLRPPVVRAGVMGCFLLAGMAMGRMTTSLASLATAAFVTLLVDPRSLLRLDWQLSYVCHVHHPTGPRPVRVHCSSAR